MAGLGFTPARGQDIFNIEAAGHSSSQPGIRISGTEARQFYETVLKEDRGPDRRQQQQHQRRARRGARPTDERLSGTRRRETEANRRGESSSGQASSSEQSKELQGLRLLRCAQEGDLSGLRELLSKGADINFQDTFFWTALMCASWTGQRAAVSLLLQRGAAWVGVVDTQGRDAKDLATEAGHSEVVEELQNFGRSVPTQRQTESRVAERHWCDVCSSEFTSSPSSHLSSTVHQFNLRRPAPAPYYCLPPSANSYKMMLRCGWKPGTGLGPEGEGAQRPVPTVLKRDHKGLGYGRAGRAKVTHFRAGDRDAVKPSREREETESKGMRKEASRRREQRDKNWERDFRASFYL